MFSFRSLRMASCRARREESLQQLQHCIRGHVVGVFEIQSVSSRSPRCNIVTQATRAQVKSHEPFGSCKKTSLHICSAQRGGITPRFTSCFSPIWRPLPPDTFFVCQLVFLNSFRGKSLSVVCPRRLQGAYKVCEMNVAAEPV